MKILMVCLGNICRSPLAEGILQNKSTKAKLNWEVDSAGTAGYHVGEMPHLLSIKIAKLNGIDISKQRCRKFIKKDIENFDFIYVMDENNYNEVKNICAELWDEKKVSLLLNELYPFENRSVPDPWYGEEEDYHIVFNMIDKACDKIISRFSNNK
jgi:protein-tyrosine phosphatase